MCYSERKVGGMGSIHGSAFVPTFFLTGNDFRVGCVCVCVGGGGGGDIHRSAYVPTFFLSGNDFGIMVVFFRKLW